MSWLDYYRLLEKYDGDMGKATHEEMRFAARANPNDPPSALALAREKYKKDHPDKFVPIPHGK